MMIIIGIKSVKFGNASAPLISSIPISFPSITHLSIGMQHDLCTAPTTIVSNLMSLKSLTNLQLTINNCEPKVDLMTLQPLATIITKL
jgi:hypothetical protein